MFSPTDAKPGTPAICLRASYAIAGTGLVHRLSAYALPAYSPVAMWRVWRMGQASSQAPHPFSEQIFPTVMAQTSNVFSTDACSYQLRQSKLATGNRLIYLQAETKSNKKTPAFLVQNALKRWRFLSDVDMRRLAPSIPHLHGAFHPDLTWPTLLTSRASSHVA
eukprot:1005025-Rhodomonas_salina.1